MLGTWFAFPFAICFLLRISLPPALSFPLTEDPLALFRDWKVNADTSFRTAVLRSQAEVSGISPSPAPVPGPPERVFHRKWSRFLKHTNGPSTNARSPASFHPLAFWLQLTSILRIRDGISPIKSSSDPQVLWRFLRIPPEPRPGFYLCKEKLSSRRDISTIGFSRALETFLQGKSSTRVEAERKKRAIPGIPPT